MNLQALGSALADLPEKIATAVADRIKGANAAHEANTKLVSENAALTQRIAALEVSGKSATDEVATIKAAADAATTAKTTAEAEVQRLKADAKTVDVAAEAKAKAILAAQGTAPAAESTPASEKAKAYVGADGKPLSGIELAQAIHAANSKKTA